MEGKDVYGRGWNLAVQVSAQFKQERCEGLFTRIECVFQ